MNHAHYRIDSKEKLPEILLNNSHTKKDIESLSDVFEIISAKPVGTKWFYLDKVQLVRQDKSQNTFKPQVKFSPCYIVHSEQLGNLVLDALEKKPEIKQKYNRPHLKAKKGKNISIRCILDCCKVLDKDIWTVLEGEEMKGHTSSKKIKIPKSSPELEEIVAWILTEGHIPLSHPSIEINQVKEDSKVLEEIARKIDGIFDVESVANFSDTESWNGKKGRRLIISSAAIRQFLVLKYNIPLGKKSKKIRWVVEVTEENYKNLLSEFIQTEGCISAESSHPRFEFKIQDECLRNACHKCLEKLGCQPQKSQTNTYNTGIYSFEDMLKLYNLVKTEINNEDLAKKISKIIEDSNILVGLKNKDWCPMIEEARQKLNPGKPNQAFVEEHNRIFPNNEINHAMVSSWALGKVPPRLSAVIVAQRVIDTPPENIFSNHLKSYISSSELKKHVQPQLR